MRTRALLERAFAWLPGSGTSALDLVLFALGAGALATVAYSTLEQLARLVLQQRGGPFAGDTLAVAAGVLVICLVRGLDRSALWVVLVHAVHLGATFFVALLTYVYLGRRAVGDPLAQLGPAFTALFVGAAVAAAAGVLVRGAIPASPADRPASPIARAIGLAILAGTVVHVLWPSGFFLAVAGATRADDARTVLISLPDLLVGSIAGGIYAARRGVGYLVLLAIGAILSLPSLLAQVLLLPSQAAADPTLRRAFAVVFLLLAVRIAAWPLARAYVEGFLTPDGPAPTVPNDT